MESCDMFNLFNAERAIAVSPQEAHELARDGKICLVDVREASEWEAQMRLPGALHAPLSKLADRLSSLPQGKPIVFYCLSGKRSARAVELCKSLGKPHDMHVAGGIAAWRSAGLPVER
jgi:rhodanese-related sulfurtransferase